MSISFQQATYLISASRPGQAPDDEGAEIAFAGRSNAGKSSALNAITGQRSLARTSKTPGRTQCLNFFTLDDRHRLVDLPGFGYAKVSASVQKRWQNTMAHYLENRQSLCGLALVMDIRHPLTSFDTQMLNWCANAGLPVHILLTKADKLSRQNQTRALQQVSKALAGYENSPSVQLFSAKSRTGVEDAREHLSGWLTSEQTGNSQ